MKSLLVRKEIYKWSSGLGSWITLYGGHKTISSVGILGGSEFRGKIRMHLLISLNLRMRHALLGPTQSRHFVYAFGHREW